LRNILNITNRIERSRIIIKSSDRSMGTLSNKDMIYNDKNCLLNINQYNDTRTMDRNTLYNLEMNVNIHYKGFIITSEKKSHWSENQSVRKSKERKHHYRERKYGHGYPQ